MLSSLHIRNYVLIDSLDIEFPKGLIVITGPTGAGKSILIGALGLLLGSKAEAGSISSGSSDCVVEGEFLLEDKALEDFCKEEDIDYNGGRLTIRRKFSAGGRSRAFVNDEPVALPVLEQLGRMLVDIHSQHDTMLLTDRKFQMAVLDAFAGNAALLDECRTAFSELKEIERKIDELRSQLEKARNESEYNASLYKALSEAGLRNGELAELEEEQFRLAHSEQIKTLMGEAVALFDSPDGSGVNSSLSSLHKCLEHLSQLLPSYSELAQRLESARIDIKDISEEIFEADSRIDCSPERLQWVDERLGTLYSLMQRHGCVSEAELIERRDSLSRLVNGVEDMEAELERQETEGKRKSDALDAVCQRLSESRKSAAPAFAAKVLSNLSFMELDRACFELSFEDAQAGPAGAQTVEYMFSGTPGRMAPVARCASGGEMSRIMLSLKQVMGEFMNMPTIIFDEIDTGVSGSVADKMGQVICNMGKSMQVFAITHLPQVAAKGDAHYMVEKVSDDGHTSSIIKKLSDEQRVLEVARMLSGSVLTPEAVANAKTLFSN